MFGKGVYFSDVFVKSQGYTRSNMSDGEVYLLLCEVALGNMSEHLQAKYMEVAAGGTQSTKGCGRTGPDFGKPLYVTYDGIKIPLQDVIQYPTKVNGTHIYHSLNYNEYIVYNEAQVKIRYLVKVKV
jgi:hypothetical protein